MATHEYTTYDRISSATRRQELRRRRRVRLSALAIGLGLPVLLAGNALVTRGEVMRGTEVAGVDVGGLAPAAARERLVLDLGERLSTPIAVRVGDVVADVTPASLGIALDTDATLDRAYRAGRVEGRLLPLLPLVRSRVVEPVLRYPRRLTLPRDLAALERRPRNAQPVVQEDGKIAVVPAADGLRYQDTESLRQIAAAAIAGEAAVTLTPTVRAAAVPTAAAEATAGQARELLRLPISIMHQGKRIGRLSPTELAPLVRVRRENGQFVLAIAPNGLRKALTEDAAAISKRPIDAHWKTDGQRARLIPGRNGRGVDGGRTADAIVAAVLKGDTRRVQVALGAVEPSMTTAEAKALDIKEKVSTVTTELGPSSANRIYNVRLMARILDGQVIAPGKTFSFNKRVGPRTPDRGFKEGQAIVGGLLLPSIGGGVCQVATTIYGAAFYAGLPIAKRLNHAWYISHYPPGMDATVADGGPDLEFTNDTPHGMLIRAWATNTTMTVSLYSTNRGVRVTKRTGDAHSFVAPKDRYILNPALTADEQIQETTGERGFVIAVERIVKRNGKIIATDTFRSNYIAEPRLFIVGPLFVPTDGGIVEDAPPEFRF